MRPVVVTVAITGSVARKADNPTVPITPAEQIESTQAAYEAGAALAHIHVREDDGTPSHDPDRFARVQEGIRRHCPGMIVQFSSSGAEPDAELRGDCLAHRPDMASLTTGSTNFAGGVYQNPAPLYTALAERMRANGVRPEIEVFDLSHLHNARRLIDSGLADARTHIQFVLGIADAMPADPHCLDLLLAETRRLLPQATWGAFGIGRFQSEAVRWALARGATGIRTGLEDNIRLSKTELADGNAALVRLAVAICAEHGARPATPDEARAMLHLK
ncbi:3-keto-5-aminohexanoate cleavage protein [Methylobacterium sp. Leaf456]|uniref:3-keto-5-aminohexanoate cleavage protein n=1 Tax=Methylobacterium sp. Leaf456 TaxID=1736382 RepID=UPI0006F5A6FE|nr:3-keto-5-aminohexanoate cleavage protein [Methylobacterium sp. Leaf456]KQT50566.1 3-keto-5-aminohexanoate cleavage protein [Methylobacterium sp. Leaf456]